MDAKQRAEHKRLQRALDMGPGRRMLADKLAGRGLTRADTEQAARYKRLMAALKEGRV